MAMWSGYIHLTFYEPNTFQNFEIVSNVSIRNNNIMLVVHQQIIVARMSYP